MIALFLSVLLGSTPAQADLKGAFKRFCERHIVASDPWPFAESDANELIQIYIHTRDQDVENELRFRIQAKMLDEKQLLQLIHLVEAL